MVMSLFRPQARTKTSEVKKKGKKGVQKSLTLATLLIGPSIQYITSIYGIGTAAA
ncbi:hypothetical protein BDZ91DRAFT_713963 [Kalaharituber pfeilii]|nr:hypothetical protein BDZ91DRAFT_713963 [Kalaharituber pfeilii]